VVPPRRRSHYWFELAKVSAGAVDSCIPDHGRGVCSQRCTMRQTALLRDGTCRLLAAGYIAFSALNLALMRPGVFLFIVFGITAAACLAEGPFGKYKRKV